MRNLEKSGKYISYLFRHGKEEYEKGLIDKNGWMNISDLILITNLSKEEIDTIVNTNNKKRYEYNEDGTKIRARQGHSIPIDVEMKEAVITKNNPYLFHGTSNRFINNIKKEGILPQTRNYVHLSKDEDTAINVGLRHGGSTCIIKIDALRMVNDGIKIFISNNGVYNVKEVNPKYFLNIYTV